MSVTEVAERAGASEGSVVALCRQIGARGFQHLKIELARALTQPVQHIHEDLEPGDEAATVMQKVFESGRQAPSILARATWFPLVVSQATNRLSGSGPAIPKPWARSQPSSRSRSRVTSSSTPSAAPVPHSSPLHSAKRSTMPH
jgi:hypothetical protein